MISKYTHIFFDLDRTLWDFRKNSAEALIDIIDKFSFNDFVQNNEEFILKYNYYNDRLWEYYRSGRIRKSELKYERFRLLLKDFNIKDHGNLVTEVSNYYMNIAPAKTSLIANAMEILKYLSATYPIYIVTNGFYDVQLSKIVNSGISPYIKKIFSSDRIGYAKPDARIFEHAIKSVNARKDGSVMIGDDEIIDIEGARNARIDQIFFNPEGRVPCVSPTYEVRGLIELKKWL